MQPIAQAIANLPSNESPAESTKPRSATLPQQHCRTFWLRMAEIYGHRWSSSFGDDPDGSAGETWAKGLAGVSAPQLAAGLSACIASADPWPPTLPDFRARCLGIPSLAHVKLLLRDEAAEKPPFMALIFQGLDLYNWRQADQRLADRMLSYAYDVAREHVMLGGALPVPRTAIESPEKRKPVPASPEVAERHMANIREKLGVVAGKDAAAGPDA